MIIDSSGLLSDYRNQIILKVSIENRPKDDQGNKACVGQEWTMKLILAYNSRKDHTGESHYRKSDT